MNARERSRLETHRRLMEEGTRLFYEKGVQHTRASDIVRAAGVAVGTLYLHFGDKEGLLRAILFEGVEALLSQLQALASSPPEDLAVNARVHAETMVRFAEERPALCRILFDAESEQAQISTEIKDYLILMQAQRLEQCVKAGLFPADLPVNVAAHAMVGMLFQTLNWWVCNPGAATREAVVDGLSRLRLACFRA